MKIFYICSNIIIKGIKKGDKGLLGYIIDKIIGYASQNPRFSKYDLAKLRFMLEVLFWNIAEFVFIAMVFIWLDKAVEFFIAFAVLMSIRIFAGGFHFKNMIICTIFTSVVFLLAIMVLPAIDIANGLMEILLLISVLITALLAPVSKRNKTRSLKSKYIFKFIATAILLVYAFLLLQNKTSPFASICTWIIFLQSTQLIIGKGLMLYENKAP